MEPETPDTNEASAMNAITYSLEKCTRRGDPVQPSGLPELGDGLEIPERPRQLEFAGQST